MGRSREITGLVASIVTFLAMGVAVAQDATWKDCELAARDPDRSIAACSELLKRPSSRAHAVTRAIADFDEAIRQDPEAPSFRFYARANALRDAGEYDRALADYQTALKLAPTNAWVLVDRGRTYARMGRSAAAKTDFDSALKLDPANEQKLRPVIEMEVAVLHGQSPPSTAQETPPQSSSPQQPAPAHRREDVVPGQSPPSTAQETPPQSPPPQVDADSYRYLIGTESEEEWVIPDWNNLGGGLMADCVWYHHYSRNNAALVLIQWALPRKPGSTHAPFRVTDVLVIPRIEKGLGLSFDCEPPRTNVFEKIFAVVLMNMRLEWWRDVRQAWKVDLGTGTISPIPTKGIACPNEYRLSHPH